MLMLVTLGALIALAVWAAAQMLNPIRKCPRCHGKGWTYRWGARVVAAIVPGVSLPTLDWDGKTDPKQATQPQGVAR